MPGGKRDECVTSEELMDYFDRRLAAGEELQLEEHMAECERCSSLARQIYALSARWDQWTAKTHADASVMGPAPLRALLAQALNRIRDVLNREQFERWIKGAEGAVRVIVGETADVAEILTEGIEILLHPQASWHFAPARISQRGFSTGTPRQVTQVETLELGPDKRVLASRWMPRPERSR